MDDDDLVIYTDGGCRPNPGDGAWAAVLRFGGRVKELVGTERNTTNNRMELLAAIKALGFLKRPCRVRLVTDSQYLRRGITEWLPQWKARGWRTAAKKKVENEDLWKRLEALSAGHQVDWDWVRGHTGDDDNERCHDLLTSALDALR